MTRGSGLLYSTGNWLQKPARAASDPRWDLEDRCMAVGLIPQIERRIGVYTDEEWPDPWVQDMPMAALTFLSQKTGWIEVHKDLSW